MRKSKWVRCVATAKKDGQRCGRMAPPDTQLCHIHARGSQSPIIPAPDHSPLGIIQHLMKDSDPRVRLQAVTTYLAKFEQVCPKCAAREEQSKNDIDVLTLHPDETVEAAAILAQYEAFKARVRSTPRATYDPDAIPQRVLDAWAEEVPTPAPVATPMTEPEDNSDEEAEAHTQVIEIEERDGSITLLEVEEVDE